MRVVADILSKHSNTSVSIYLNGKKVADTIQTDATIYPSGMLVARVIPTEEESPTLGYTKHYYAGTQRVSSKIGTTENLGDFLQDWITQGLGGPVDAIGSSMDVLENAEAGVTQVYTELGIDNAPDYNSSPTFIPVPSFVHDGHVEKEVYWFHPDHLGSTSYITNLLGEVSQHMEYFAFGETFVEEHRSSNNSPYKFNGKELDEETGWYYYGARYYDPRVSMWLSVDPLMEKYPGWSPYNYTLQNPVRFIDPDGNSPYDHHFDAYGNFLFDDFNGSNNIVIHLKTGASSPSQLDYSKKGSISTLLKIQVFYAKFNKTFGSFGIGESAKGYTSSQNPGYTTSKKPNTSFLNILGGLDNSMDNYYNMMSVIKHEHIHQQNFKDGEKTGGKLYNHIEVYLGQMADDTFSKTTSEFKKGIIGSFGNYLLQMNEDEINSDRINDYIDQFNDLKTGYEIDKPRTWGASPESLNVNTPEGSSFKAERQKEDIVE